MPTIPVNDEGAVLYYEDSGSPVGVTDYSTIVILHGFVYHGAIFRSLFPHALSQNIRLVLVNQREYPGSSLLNEREMANVYSPEPEKQATALREQALELGTFIARFIEAENVPAPKRVGGKDVGGVSLLAWSQGNGHLFSLLSNISHLKRDTHDLLERYMRSMFIYDPPCPVAGIPFPPGLMTPFQDPSVSEMDKPLKFVDYVATYWSPLQTPESITMEAMLTRYDMHKATGDERYLATTARMSKSFVASLIAPEIWPRVGIAMAFEPEVYEECLRGALFDTKGAWSHLKVIAMWPDMTIWPCSLSGKVIADMLASPPEEGKVRRDVEMVRVNGVNHVWHYEEPEQFVQFLASHV